MVNRSDFISSFVRVSRSMWTVEKRETLARIAVHERQFENWWKFELATSLWEMATPINAKVLVETYQRADIAIAYTKKTTCNDCAPDPSSNLCVPIELKTTGTWWPTPGKALEENNQNRLRTDLENISGGGLIAKPCGIVGLLLTDSKGDQIAIEKFSSHAKKLGDSFGLELIESSNIDLPLLYNSNHPKAIQLFWASN